MTCAGFLVFLFLCVLNNWVLFSCEGQVIPPLNQSMIVVLPGSTARLKWTFLGDPSQVFYREWYFTRRGGSKREVIAAKILSEAPTIANNSLPGVDIEDAATVVLKKVDKRYNGKYGYTVFSYEGDGYAEVDLFIAEAPTVTFNCSSRVILNEGDNFTCVCRGEDGGPPASVTWFKDGVQISGTGTENKTLTLRNVEKTASGTYKCVAQSHTLFTDEKSLKMIVYDKPAALKETNSSEWYIVVVSLVSGIVIGLFLAYILLCVRRRWFRKREPGQNPEAQTAEVDPTYQELDLAKMNKEDNYQSLRVNAAVSDQDANGSESTYTELSKTRDVENNYEYLT